MKANIALVTTLLASWNSSKWGSPLAMKTSFESQLINLYNRVKNWFLVEELAEDVELDTSMLASAYVYVCDPVNYERNINNLITLKKVQFNNFIFDKSEFDSIMTSLI